MPKLRGMDLQKALKVVMWDGEGCNKEDGTQDYAILCNSEGLVLKNDDLSHLETAKIFETLINNRGDDKTLHVIFGGSYDATMWLRQLSEVESLKHENGLSGTGEGFLRTVYLQRKDQGTKRASVPIRLGGYVYKTTYRARKQFSLSQTGTVAEDGTVSLYKKPKTITIWDIQGTYATTFLKALKAFQLITPEDYLVMKDMKDRRTVFSRDMLDEIIEYCLSECRHGAALYRKTLDYLCSPEVDTVLHRHDGAGALSSATLKKMKVNEALPDRDKSVFGQDVITSVRRAYFGGRIENGQIGRFEDLREDDVNSAYPSKMLDLPVMKGGSWVYHVGHPPETPEPGCLYIVDMRWDFTPGMHFYPLPYRTIEGEVLFPNTGAGEYWYPEYIGTLTFCERFGEDIPDVKGYWKFTSACPDEKPLRFLQDLYNIRLLNKKTIGLVLKYLMNACYGKFCQQLGGTRSGETSKLRLPPFFCQEWAGMITAATRAQLVDAACRLKDPKNFVGFATDAILSLEDIEGLVESTKLGDWERKSFPRATIIMAGVRYVEDPTDPDAVEGWVAKTRGFPASAMPTPDRIHEAWRAGKKTVTVQVSRFYSFSSAILGGEYWGKRGSWERVEREIDISGDCPKRHDNDEIYSTIDEEISWRGGAQVDSSAGIKHVCLPVKTNVSYEMFLNEGITLYSQPYKNLESNVSPTKERLIQEFEER